MASGTNAVASDGAEATAGPPLRLPFVDAHFHLWDRALLRYPWLAAPEYALIAPTYRIDDYRRDTVRWNLVGAVHVEAGADPADSRAETEWLTTITAPDTLPTAIVAHVALDASDVEAALAWQAGQRGVRGVRHIVNWHPSDTGRCAHGHDLTRDPAWRRGYALLGRYGLSFDFHGFPPQLAGLAEVAALHPEVPVVLNHLALPILADGLDAWRAGIAALAALPHVAIKLSGAGYIDRTLDAERIGGILREAVDTFGCGRVMIGTNFPVDRLTGDLDRTLGTYETLLAAFSEDERRDMWGRNANRFYRLGLTL